MSNGNGCEVKLVLTLGVSGLVDQRLLDHLGEEIENCFHSMKQEGLCTPNTGEEDLYEDTEMELTEVLSSRNSDPTANPHDWFASVPSGSVFLINGRVCGDFSFPSPDDDYDDAYSFYIYGPDGYLSEIDIFVDSLRSFKVVNAQEAVFEVEDGTTFEFKALS